MKPRAYVETNFLIEMVLDQDDASACKGILDLARDGKIELFVPASAFTEAAETLRRRRHDLTEVRQAAEVRAKVAGLDRTAAVREMGKLVERQVVEIDGRRTTVLKDVRGLATVIHTTDGAIDKMIDDEELNPPDAIIIACIRAHIGAPDHGGNHDIVFITSDKNLADGAQLEQLGCHASISSLDGGLNFLRSQVDLSD